MDPKGPYIKSQDHRGDGVYIIPEDRIRLIQEAFNQASLEWRPGYPDEGITAALAMVLWLPTLSNFEIVLSYIALELLLVYGKAVAKGRPSLVAEHQDIPASAWSTLKMQWSERGPHVRAKGPSGLVFHEILVRPAGQPHKNVSSLSLSYPAPVNSYRGIESFNNTKLVTLAISQVRKENGPIERKKARLINDCTEWLTHLFAHRNQLGLPVPRLAKKASLATIISKKDMPWNQRDWRPMTFQEIQKLRI